MKRGILELIGVLGVWMEWLAGWIVQPQGTIQNIKLAIDKRQRLLGAVFVHKGFEGCGGLSLLRANAIRAILGNRFISPHQFSDSRHYFSSLLENQPVS